MSSENNKYRFKDSVDVFSSNDSAKESEKDRRAAIGARVIRIALLTVCFAIFAFAVGTMIMNALETEAVNELYESIRPNISESEVKPSVTPPIPKPMTNLSSALESDGIKNEYVSESISPEEWQRRATYYRNFKSFSSNYADAYAWIYVNHTKIDYPVMKGEYNDFYLFNNIYKSPSSSGSITAESSMSDVYSENRNNVFYGHCMKNGTMFRTLKTFMESANRNTLAKSMNIEVYTTEGLYIYKVLSGYRNDQSFFIQTNFDSDESFYSFLKTVSSYNILRVTNPYDETSSICTLMTCANVTSNEEERYVLHGVLVEFIPASQF